MGSEDATLSQKVEVEAFTFAQNDLLTLTAYIDAKQKVTGKIRLVIKYADDSLDKSKVDLDLHQTDGYELFTASLNLKSGDIDSIKVSINYRTSSGKMYVDDVKLLKTTSAPVVPLP
jgi:hypothetical protein